MLAKIMFIFVSLMVTPICVKHAPKHVRIAKVMFKFKFDSVFNTESVITRQPVNISANNFLIAYSYSRKLNVYKI